MKSVLTIFGVLSIIFFTGTGCDKPRLPIRPTAVTDDGLEKLSSYARYAPEKIDILPLTELVFVDDIDRSGIDLYISLLDQYGCQVKSPGTFRFELYEHVPLSGEPKGKRIKIWPDFDLNDPEPNNEYWQDYLRTYEFNLPFDLAGTLDYILEVTCFCPNGRRLMGKYTLRSTE